MLSACIVWTDNTALQWATKAKGPCYPSTLNAPPPGEGRGAAKQHGRLRVRAAARRRQRGRVEARRRLELAAQKGGLVCGWGGIKNREEGEGFKEGGGPLAWAGLSSLPGSRPRAFSVYPLKAGVSLVSVPLPGIFLARQ